MQFSVCGVFQKKACCAFSGAMAEEQPQKCSIREEFISVINRLDALDTRGCVMQF